MQLQYSYYLPLNVLYGLLLLEYMNEQWKLPITNNLRNSAAATTPSFEIFVVSFICDLSNFSTHSFLLIQNNHSIYKIERNLFFSHFYKWWMKKKKWAEIEKVEERGIDPLTSRMLSERSTIWATPPVYLLTLYRSFETNISNRLKLHHHLYYLYFDYELFDFF